jgi:hypothetical protein
MHLLSCTRAVLGAYFLKEELGTLGRLGCAICLIGSVVIVLHAPPDKDIETVDQILNYALNWGMFANEFHGYNANNRRLSTVLLHCSSLLIHHDIQSRPGLWQKEPPNIYIDLFNSRIGVSHGCQSVRYCSEAHIGWEKSIYTPFYVRICNSGGCLHSNANELFQ